jgi:FlaA1/EpsC-like NDP-sugar epimerase
MKIFRGYLFKAIIAVADSLVIIVALVLAYMIRFDFLITAFYARQLFTLLPIFILIRVSALYYCRSYHFLWRYAGINDFMKVIKAVGLGLAVLAAANYFRNYPFGMLIALGFFLSSLFHRGVLHFLPLMRHRRLLVIGATLLSAVLLAGGFVIFTVVRSAPTKLAEIPWGDGLERFDFTSDLAMPRGVLIMESILSFVLLSGIRIGPRIFFEVFGSRFSDGRRTLIFGAGDEGEALVRGTKKQAGHGYRLIGFIDDDLAKQRVSIHGISVLGTRTDLSRLIDQHRIQELIITPISLSDSDMQEVASICWQKHVSIWRVAGLSRLIGQDLGIEHLENVDIAELLGRPEIELDPGRVTAYLRDRTVMITGAGGSIGAELGRQVARCRPARLILLGKGENSIYTIQNELCMSHSDVDIISVIGDICNPGKMDYIFRSYRPDVVFHAAAHKHVPFMEDNPEESVWNNIFGTHNVGSVAQRHGTAIFVMISSDKAVNPTSVMGVTKRVAELVLRQLADENRKTIFTTVRFGNVLRSRGSVIPFFEKQIETGGPVTVTHPEMSRYFMSIPEAVRLVLHSGAIGRNGDLCILDMGKPVKILDLAENMIRMAGKVPYEDIEIVFTGIRPGEKLYEELFTEDEAKCLQKIDRISIARTEGGDWSYLDAKLAELREASIDCRRDDVIRILREIVPSYQPPHSVTQSA